jgi:hypothetical protein
MGRRRELRRMRALVVVALRAPTAYAFKQSSARSCVRSEKKIEKKTAVT